VSLAAVLDCIVPPQGGMPGAGALAARFEAELTRRDRWKLVGELINLVRSDFGRIATEAQTAHLRELEQQHAAAFAELVQLVYGVYYTDRVVLGRVEATTGRPARPPQPLGYSLAPFDESVLERVRKLPPSYRTP
jgi:hypothetical protein